MSLRVVKPGLLTTLQDRGRPGLPHLGIAAGGPMDRVAAALANALVGNTSGEALLEITLIGPELDLEHDMLVALCGAELEARAGGAVLPRDRPVLVRAGTRLVTGRAWRGSRGYLAVAGGFSCAEVLGSRATCLPGRFGGLEGRALRAGDVLELAPDAPALAAGRFARLAASARDFDGLRSVRWSAPSLTLPDSDSIVVHAMEGRHAEQFDAPSRRAFFDGEWRVAPDSNRMGYRLGGAALARARAAEILSEPTCLGTVQVPSGGAPIVLMADHQTTGGYPRIAEVAGADVPRLAQLAPGAHLRFARCSLEDARGLGRALRARLEAALRGIAWRYGHEENRP